MSEWASRSLDIRRAAPRRSAPRDHSRTEWFTKRHRRSPETFALIKEELGALSEEGLQSDRRLAEVYVRSRAAQGRGSEKIRTELREKGVGDEEITKALLNCDVNWLENLDRVSSKRFGNSSPKSIMERAKRTRFFRQRGFSYDEIGTLL